MSGQLFYYVACGRRDKLQPGLEKAQSDLFFLTLEDAEEFAAEVRDDLGMNEEIKVFCAIAYPYPYKVKQ